MDILDRQTKEGGARKKRRKEKLKEIKDERKKGRKKRRKEERKKVAWSPVPSNVLTEK